MPLRFFKRILPGITLLFLISPLIAATNSKTLFQQGETAFKNQDYSLAARKFKQILAEDPKNIQAGRLAGISLSRSGQPLAALPLLEKSLQATQDPDLFGELGHAYLEAGEYRKAVRALEIHRQVKPRQAKTHLALGRALLKLGLLERAETTLKEATQLDPGLAAVAQKYQDQIVRPDIESHPVELVKPNKFWQVIVAVIGGYNSNVIGLPDDRPLPADISEKGSPFINSSVDGQYFWPLDSNDHVSIGYNFSSVFYSNVTASDSINHEWRVRYDRTVDREWSASLLVTDDFSQIGNKDFRNRVQARPSAVYQIADQSIVEFAYAVAVSDYFRPNTVAAQNRDGHSHTFSASSSFTVPKTDLRTDLGIFGGFDETIGNDFDSSHYGLTLGGSHPLLWKIQGGIFYTLRFEQYNHLNSVAGANGFTFARDDRSDAITIQLSRPVLDWLTLTFQYQYYHLESNILFYTYSQDIFSFGAKAIF
jgi:tetratricopeptide (TPR) repeat protein